MTQKHFLTQLLVCCHLMSEESGMPKVSAGAAIDRYTLDYEDGWVTDSLFDLVENDLVFPVAKYADELTVEIQLTERGHEVAEDWLDSGALRFVPEGHD